MEKKKLYYLNSFFFLKKALEFYGRTGKIRNQKAPNQLVTLGAKSGEFGIGNKKKTTEEFLIFYWPMVK